MDVVNMLVADLEGWRTHAPCECNFWKFSFSFHEKTMLNSKLAHPLRLAPPPLGNPWSGFATASSDYFVKKKQKTNKKQRNKYMSTAEVSKNVYSSRKHTVCCSGHLVGGGVCPGVSTQGEVSAYWGCLPRGCLPRGCSPPPPRGPWTDRQVKKHYLTATTVAEGNYRL